MNRRTFLGGLAALLALPLVRRLPYVPRAQRWIAKRTLIAGERIPEGALVMIGSDGKAYRSRPAIFNVLAKVESTHGSDPASSYWPTIRPRDDLP